MTYDEWLNDLNEYTIELPRTYKDFHKNFGELVWQAATIAERERCALICHPNFIGEHGGKDDRYDLARMDMYKAIRGE